MATSLYQHMLRSLPGNDVSGVFSRMRRWTSHGIPLPADNSTAGSTTALATLAAVVDHVPYTRNANNTSRVLQDYS